MQERGQGSGEGLSSQAQGPQDGLLFKVMRVKTEEMMAGREAQKYSAFVRGQPWIPRSSSFKAPRTVSKKAATASCLSHVFISYLFKINFNDVFP
jgi:hypothetical protein